MEEIKVTKIISSSTKNIIGVIINGKTYTETETESFKSIFPKLVQMYGREFENKFFSKNTKIIIKEVPYKIQTITDKDYKRVLGVIINGKPYIETKYQSFEELFPKIKEAYGKQFEEEYYSENNKCITIEEYNQKVTKDIEQKVTTKENTKIKNIKPYINNLNMCREDVLSSKQIELKHSDYVVGQMTATQDVGKQRSGQEDSVIILEHPQNKEFKLIAVADGVGGSALGEIASNTVLKKLTKWFETLNPKAYEDVTQLQDNMKNLLQNILQNAPIPRESTTTLSAVIIGKNQTLITNVGDSRVYTTNNGKITQQTTDDSYVQELFEHNKIPSKEIMRFHRHSNRITNGISKAGVIDKPNFKVIPNKSYDRIIATSDGVTDLISEKELEILMTKSKPNKIAQNIVEYALNNDSHIETAITNLPLKEKVKSIKELEKNSQMYDTIIKQGKDNTSAVSFAKK